jgi:hypothetical protein
LHKLTLTMRLFPILRLLLDVYGAAFLGYMLISAAVYGVFPYAALMRLGSLMFYALLGGAFVVWLWLAGRRLARGNDTDPSNPKEN